MRFCVLVAVAIFSVLPQSPAFAQMLLVPMDLKQSDHLKAYGVAYWILERGYNVEWLLNYRGGSFMTDATEEIVLPINGSVERQAVAARLVRSSMIPARALSARFTDSASGKTRATSGSRTTTLVPSA